MTHTITIAPVRKTVRVNLPQAEAFEVFASGIDRWWPRTHHLGSSPMTAAVIEPFVGGRWYNSCEDGSEADFGHVLVWQPPERLMLAWQTDGNCHYDQDLVTEVDIKFIAEGAAATCVELEHRHIERLGDKAETFRGQVDHGWGVVLECFAKTADSTLSR